MTPRKETPIATRQAVINMRENGMRGTEIAKRMSLPLDRVIEVSDLDHYNRLINQNPNKIMILDFFATWCGPCKEIAPIYKEFSLKYKNVLFLKIDVDEVEDICSKFDVKLMPTFIFIRNGNQIDLLEGGYADQLEAKILKHAAL